MKNIFSLIRRWLFAPRAAATAEHVLNLSSREWADLPTYHPSDECMPTGL